MGASSQEPVCVQFDTEAARNAIFSDIKARFAKLPEIGKFNQEI
jgi:hypothetical protein